MNPNKISEKNLPVYSRKKNDCGAVRCLEFIKYRIRLGRKRFDPSATFFLPTCLSRDLSTPSHDPVANPLGAQRFEPSATLFAPICLSRNPSTPPHEPHLGRNAGLRLWVVRRGWTTAQMDREEEWRDYGSNGSDTSINSRDRMEPQSFFFRLYTGKFFSLILFGFILIYMFWIDAPICIPLFGSNIVNHLSVHNNY